MGNRIKLVREAIGKKRGKKFSQSDFAEACKVSRDVIANYENGRVEPSKIFIQYICKEYGVNETWLLTGNGEMFAPLTEEQEKAQLLASILDETVPHRLEFIKLLSRMSEDTLKELYEELLDIFDKRHPEE